MGTLIVLMMVVLSIMNESVAMADGHTTKQTGEAFWGIYYVQTQPEFLGGNEALMKWLGQNIVYPMEALNEGITGRVIMKFVIEKDGTISNSEIVNGAHPLLDTEVLRVISVMPKWIPVKKNGQPVKCYYTLPVSFVVDDIG